MVSFSIAKYGKFMHFYSPRSDIFYFRNSDGSSITSPTNHIPIFRSFSIPARSCDRLIDGVVRDSLFFLSSALVPKGEFINEADKTGSPCLTGANLQHPALYSHQPTAFI